MTVKCALPKNSKYRSVLIREVSLFQGLKSTQTWYLGRKRVSCLVKNPYFRGVLIDGCHCIHAFIHSHVTHSETPLIWTLLGQSNVSSLERCPYFRD